MARPKRVQTTAEQIEQTENLVLKTKEAYDEAGYHANHFCINLTV